MFLESSRVWCTKIMTWKHKHVSSKIRPQKTKFWPRTRTTTNLSLQLILLSTLFLKRKKWECPHYFFLAFQGNVRLRKLRMSSNQLDSLASFTFPSMGHLRLIDLGYNQLTRISTATFTNLGKIQKLNMCLPKNWRKRV